MTDKKEKRRNRWIEYRYTKLRYEQRKIEMKGRWTETTEKLEKR